MKRDRKLILTKIRSSEMTIAVTGDAMHQPIEFFHLHAGIVDYFHSQFCLALYKIDKIS